MNRKQLVDLINTTFDQVHALQQDKGLEYAGNQDEDRLLNFRQTAVETGLSMEKVLYVFAHKHWMSIAGSIRGEHNGHTEPIEGRINDLILYLIILKAIKQETAVARSIKDTSSPTERNDSKSDTRSHKSRSLGVSSSRPGKK